MTVPDKSAEIRHEGFQEGYEIGFRGGEVFALKQAVAHLRGQHDAAVDEIERMIAEKEGA